MRYRTAKRLLLAVFGAAAIAQFWVGVLWPLIGLGVTGLALTWLVKRQETP